MRSKPLLPTARRVWAVAAITVAAGLGLAACGGSSSSATTAKAGKSTVPISDDSTPNAAVTNYLAALARHDTTLARMLVDPKSRTVITSAHASGFEDLVKLTGVRILSVQTGSQYRPEVNGYKFPKQKQFAVVTVDYSSTFNAAEQSGNGPQTRHVTLGLSKNKRWLILTIAS
jgi:hypothetical protein